MSSARLGLIACAMMGAGALASTSLPRQDPQIAGWKQHDTRRPKPPVVEPPEDRGSVPPPKDAVVLFDGTNLDAWQAGRDKPAGWTVADGALEVKPGAGAIDTKERFGDLQLHVEWASPLPANGRGQGRGNSGIKFMGRYEIQVLDSYKADSYADGMAGAIYGMWPPLANASRPPGEWQAYDIAFRRPRIDTDGHVVEPARVTVFHNGLLVQDNEPILGTTSYIRRTAYAAGDDAPAPIQLQDHGHKVRYRNIWARSLPDRPLPTAEQATPEPRIVLSAEELDRYVGEYGDGKTWGSPIRREGDHLTITLIGRPHPFVPVGPDAFAMVGSDSRVTFRRDDQGRLTGAQLTIGGDGRTLVRKP